MNLDDLRLPGGPYWAAYQAERARSRIVDDPDRVPVWFLARLARERLAAARVELERLSQGGVRTRGYGDAELLAVHRALRTVEGFVRYASSDAAKAVVGGLLGGQEIATELEHAEFGRPSLTAVVRIVWGVCSAGQPLDDVLPQSETSARRDAAAEDGAVVVTRYVTAPGPWTVAQ